MCGVDEAVVLDACSDLVRQESRTTGTEFIPRAGFHNIRSGEADIDVTMRRLSVCRAAPVVNGLCCHHHGLARLDQRRDQKDLVSWEDGLTEEDVLIKTILGIDKRLAQLAQRLRRHLKCAVLFAVDAVGRRSVIPRPITMSTLVSIDEVKIRRLALIESSPVVSGLTGIEAVDTGLACLGLGIESPAARNGRPSSRAGETDDVVLVGQGTNVATVFPTLFKTATWPCAIGSSPVLFPPVMPIEHCLGAVLLLWSLRTTSVETRKGIH